MEVDNKGLRYSEGKPRFDLIPPDALRELADHFRKGAEKYELRNWERGMNWSECYRAMLSHAGHFWEGDDIDPENGSYHITAALWNAMALLTYQLRNIGVDDRAKVQGREVQEAHPAKEPHSEGLTVTQVLTESSWAASR